MNGWVSYLECNPLLINPAPTSLPQPEDDTSNCPKAEECKCSSEKYYLGKI